MRKWIFAALMLYTAIEVALLIQLGNWLGLGWVMLWVAGTVLAGLGVLRTQGISAMRRIAHQLQMEILPTKELVDLGLVVGAALLLISPGVIADVVGLLLLSPFGRFVARRLTFHWLPRWLPEETPDSRLRVAAANVIEIEREPQG